MDDYLFKVVDNDVEVVRPPFQNIYEGMVGKTNEKPQDEEIQASTRQQKAPKVNFPSNGLM